MKGSLLARLKRDANKFVTAGGFQEDIFLETVDGLVSVQTTGTATKHWINFDADSGASINSKNAQVTLSEEALSALGYPVRNTKQEVDLYKHRVSYEDSTGIMKHYVINEWFPDETLGLIVCILGDYDSN